MGFVLFVDGGRLVVFGLELSLSNLDVRVIRFSSSLQKSLLQRQAKIDAEPSSVISL